MITELLEMYKMIRQECMEAIKNQHSLLMFAITGLSVVSSAFFIIITDAGAGNWRDDLIFLYSGLFVPVFLLLSLVIWSGEVQRMMRAGNYLFAIETMINEENKSYKIVMWETYLRQTKPYKTVTNQSQSSYIAVITVFLGLAIFAILFSFWWQCVKPTLSIKETYRYLPLIIIFISTIFFIWTFLNLWRMRRLASESSVPVDILKRCPFIE